MMTQEELLKTYGTLSTKERLELEHFIAKLRKQHTEHPKPKKKLRPIREEPFFGMWKDREDMADPVEWVRKIRREHWGPNRKIKE